MPLFPAHFIKHSINMVFSPVCFITVGLIVQLIGKLLYHTSMHSFHSEVCGDGDSTVPFITLPMG